MTTCLWGVYGCLVGLGTRPVVRIDGYTRGCVIETHRMVGDETGTDCGSVGCVHWRICGSTTERIAQSDKAVALGAGKNVAEAHGFGIGR